MKLRVCIPSLIKDAQGGPGSFQKRLADGLIKRGIEVANDLNDKHYDIVLIIGGSRKLPQLWRCKRQSTPIIQRLDGINWRHRIIPTSFRNRNIAILRNFLLKTIRNHLANRVIYQSKFAQSWWHEWYGPAPCPETIIYNAVDLSTFRPESVNENSKKEKIMLCAEGNIQPDEVTKQVLIGTHRNLFKRNIIERTFVYGNITPEMAELLRKEKGIYVAGPVPLEDMPVIFRKAALYLSLDINTACPNAVIEALASGVPVVSFDTGSLAELILPGGGIVVPYGADPWKLDTPDISSLCDTAQKIMAAHREFSREARILAEERFDINQMVENYVDVFKQ